MIPGFISVNVFSMRRVSNPPNPFHHAAVEWEGPPPEIELTVYEDRSRSILSRNTSPDLPFEYSLNPYRGCMHACAYCYARPTHEYLDFGAGTDFDRKIVVKPEAPELLRRAFMRKRWKGALVLFSGNTDCYQPLEATWRLTRGCLKTCLEFRNPVGVITKSALIERDVDVLAALVETARCRVTLSIPFWDPDACRKVEPWAPAPARRMKAVRRLTEAGIPVGVHIAPVICGLNDRDVPAILEAAAEAGATRAGITRVRLVGAVRIVFEERIRRDFPLAADKILGMQGRDEYWQAVKSLFDTTAARLGLNVRPDHGALPGDEPTTFRRPPPEHQLLLFGGSEG